MQIFADCGKVLDLHIFTEKDSGHSKGAAFVYMATQDDADAAILSLHNKRTIPPMTRPLVCLHVNPRSVLPIVIHFRSLDIRVEHLSSSVLHIADIGVKICSMYVLILVLILLM